MEVFERLGEKADVVCFFCSLFWGGLVWLGLVNFVRRDGGGGGETGDVLRLRDGEMGHREIGGTGGWVDTVDGFWSLRFWVARFVGRWVLEC